MTDRMITYSDYNRLMDQLYRDLKHANVLPGSLHHLYLLLETSRKCIAEDIPEDVITMNSQVIIRNVTTGIKRNIAIVYPDRDIVWDVKEFVNIYDPLGLALLGRKEHEIIDSNIKAETGRKESYILVERILFQPEASGLFVL